MDGLFFIQIQHLLKLNKLNKTGEYIPKQIQIQHLLKLNNTRVIKTIINRPNSNTTFVKVKCNHPHLKSKKNEIQIQHLLKLNSVGLPV